MPRIINEIVKNPNLLIDFKNKPNHNLIKIQTITGSKYLGYIKDCDEEGIWFEPLFDEFYPAYIFNRDIKKIIVPTNPDEEKETVKKERSWFTAEE
ncbi:MAG: hypothetical protein FIB08_16460 [Candidatus Methanoperedens sp.]|nr:hypothetical protein [Candidatus Methanoperedens sp.]